MGLSEISVVVPTRNCLHLVQSGMKEMLTWTPLVKEVLVVDSESSDGTLDYLKEQLQYPNVRFLTHPPGLYQSWNFGISQTTGKWVHISTAGDTISTDDLQYLALMAERTDADVTTAPPHFVMDGDYTPPWLNWPIHDLLARQQEGDFIVLEGLSLLVFAMEYCRPGIGVQSWLGSSASNLYKRRFFEGRGFPTNCGHSGDVMFGLSYAAEMKAAFLRRPCGKFVFHRPTTAQPNVVERFGEVYGAEYLRCQSILNDRLREAMLKCGLQDLLTPMTEASWWRALHYSPEDMIRIGAQLQQEKTKRETAQEKLAALRPERDEWKERAKAAETALRRCRKIIPSFLRRWLGVETPAKPESAE
ncbi:MAG: glycosyltransferase family 2 protein [Verrucomicrobiaceae bacterium]|nr:glycosyltransferase family 2 protein [Verrucomicrobiaceae bacterium]